MKTIKSLALGILIGLSFACSNTAKTDGVNYFEKSGLITPTFKNENLNQHLKSFEELFNELGTAATIKDKAKRNNFSIAYSDWILDAKKFKDSISNEDQKKLDNYLESTTVPWNVLKNNLF